ncbi:putative Importin-7 [Monocercomonoides exilis]|uniref:putative Importin-7 n=1 Tax=Monocercomonoides exilis TaxID=2049356 RepID=UPI003559DE55|nr:putative Importin-7 [Monocercomonoides exilis]|eukprot:MONOS_7101.1-p1 / transcript=MONOS_7101.1 / gene=MONOS_7101 / organism=Monocercomonoides_exilis_PA203 / gene_product=Importin-7 / transcript_product=Importin-7 / location=Mono_scaffold00236:8099-13467(-) / protein_length=1575 / sequence_SO=supercontig / SO=protein_coding / is_pseudo=false
MLQFTMNSSVDIQIRKAAVIQLKNQIELNWKSGGSKESKDYLRNNIVHAIVAAPPSIVKFLMRILFVIAPFDFPKKLPTFNEAIIKYISSDDSNMISGAVNCLLPLAQAFMHWSWRDCKPYFDLFSSLQPRLIQICEGIIGAKSLDPLLGYVARKMLKIFYSTIRSHLPPCICEDEAFKKWMAIIGEFYSLDIPLSAVQNPSLLSSTSFWRAKKWAAQSLDLMFDRYGTPSKVGTKRQKEFCQRWTAQYALPLLDVTVKLLQKHKQSGTFDVVDWTLLQNATSSSPLPMFMTPKVLVPMLEILLRGTTHRCFYVPILRPQLLTLFNDIIFPTLRLQQPELERWDDAALTSAQTLSQMESDRDYVLFVEESDRSLFSSRYASSRLLKALLSNFPRSAVPVLTSALGAALVSLSSSTSSPSSPSASPSSPSTQSQLWLQMDAALTVLGISSTALIASQPAQQLEGILSQFVLPTLESPEPRLRIRGCWCLSCFVARMKFTMNTSTQSGYPPLVDAIVTGIMKCFNDSRFAVKMHAIFAIPDLLAIKQNTSQSLASSSSFATSSTTPVQLHPLLLQNASVIVTQLMQILPLMSESEDLLESIQSIITTFSATLRPTAPFLFASLCLAWLRALFKAQRWNVALTPSTGQAATAAASSSYSAGFPSIGGGSAQQGTAFISCVADGDTAQSGRKLISLNRKEAMLLQHLSTQMSEKCAACGVDQLTLGQNIFQSPSSSSSSSSFSFGTEDSSSSAANSSYAPYLLLDAIKLLCEVFETDVAIQEQFATIAAPAASLVMAVSALTNGITLNSFLSSVHSVSPQMFCVLQRQKQSSLSNSAQIRSDDSLMFPDTVITLLSLFTNNHIALSSASVSLLLLPVVKALTQIASLPGANTLCDSLAIIRHWLLHSPQVLVLPVQSIWDQAASIDSAQLQSQQSGEVQITSFGGLPSPQLPSSTILFDLVKVCVNFITSEDDFSCAVGCSLLRLVLVASRSFPAPSSSTSSPSPADGGAKSATSSVLTPVIPLLVNCLWDRLDAELVNAVNVWMKEEKKKKKKQIKRQKKGKTVVNPPSEVQAPSLTSLLNDVLSWSLPGKVLVIDLIMLLYADAHSTLSHLIALSRSPLPPFLLQTSTPSSSSSSSSSSSPQAAITTVLNSPPSSILTSFLSILFEGVQVYKGVSSRRCVCLSLSSIYQLPPLSSFALVGSSAVPTPDEKNVILIAQKNALPVLVKLLQTLHKVELNRIRKKGIERVRASKMAEKKKEKEAASASASASLASASSATATESVQLCFNEDSPLTLVDEDFTAITRALMQRAKLLGDAFDGGVDVDDEDAELNEEGSDMDDDDDDDDEDDEGEFGFAGAMTSSAQPSQTSAVGGAAEGNQFASGFRTQGELFTMMVRLNEMTGLGMDGLGDDDEEEDGEGGGKGTHGDGFDDDDDFNVDDDSCGDDDDDFLQEKDRDGRNSCWVSDEEMKNDIAQIDAWLNAFTQTSPFGLPTLPALPGSSTTPSSTSTSASSPVASQPPPPSVLTLLDPIVLTAKSWSQFTSSAEGQTVFSQILAQLDPQTQQVAQCLMQEGKKRAAS